MDYKKLDEWIKDKHVIPAFIVGIIIGWLRTIGIFLMIVVLGLYFYFLKYGNKN